MDHTTEEDDNDGADEQKQTRYNGKFITKKDLSKKLKRIQLLSEIRQKRRVGNKNSDNKVNIIVDDSVHSDHSYSKPLNLNVVESEVEVSTSYSNDEEVSDVDNDIDVDLDINWTTGRRVVELGVLADNLRACQLCSQPLHLANCVGEKKFGLAQILMIKCTYEDCGLVNSIPTGSRHRTDRGGLAWDVNTKLANDASELLTAFYTCKCSTHVSKIACHCMSSMMFWRILIAVHEQMSFGIINGGCGETHANYLLAILNIPGVCKKSLKDREREVGRKLVEYAKESCKNALEEEVELAGGDVTAGFDGGWQKRGTGRAYNSLSGHATIIGEKTGKCLGYDVKSKVCRICDAAARRQIEPREHECCNNWNGSAKAMEPAMACTMLEKVLDQGHRVSTIAMDNDSTTMAKIRAEVDPSVNKKADRNHTKKSFTGALIELSNSHKTLRNVKVRTHIDRCFAYCLQQHQGNPEQLGKALEAIVPHLYGDHHLCGSWCRSADDGYKPKNLPYGRPLSDVSLRTALEELMLKYSAKSDVLSNLGSSQANENFNEMVATKAPKRVFYSGSDSLVSRVSAAVCQKNEGYSYVSELNEKCSVSPGKFTKRHTMRMEKELKRKRILQQSVAFKRQRLLLKAKRMSKEATKTVLEGDTYNSNVALGGGEDLNEIKLTPAVSPNTPMMYFDLETTGLERTSGITQIAAVCGEKSFSTYITPSCPIGTQASRATGLSVSDGKMFYQGKEVPSCMPADGLTHFVDFVKTCGKPVIVGHNIQNFDVPIIIYNLSQHALLESFSESVSGFIDTLKLAKRVFHKSEVQGSYKQENLVKCVLGKEYNAHNAFDDVMALRELHEKKMLSHKSFSDNDVFQLSYYTCKPSLDALVLEKVISRNVQQKLAAHSLGLPQLTMIHRRDSVNGIANVLRELNVAKSTSVMNRLNDYLNSLK